MHYCLSHISDQEKPIARLTPIKSLSVITMATMLKKLAIKVQTKIFVREMVGKKYITTHTSIKVLIIT